MARNRYPGTCYCCGEYVPTGFGHFERYRGHWRIKCVIERRNHIESDYQYMDSCDEKGCEWDNPWGVVEYETYKEYTEPLFENLEDQHEVRRSRKDGKE